MGLNEQYDAVLWTATHYVYVEKTGPFQETAPKAWQELLQFKGDIAKGNQINGAFSMYKVAPQIYRAGFSLVNKPNNLPDGLKYTLFEGGQYIRFVLTGPYSQLPQACGRVFELIDSEGIKTVDNFFVENCVNQPESTPEDQLITEILVPTGYAVKSGEN